MNNEEEKVLTLGDLRRLDLPDETPIILNNEAGSYLVTEVVECYISQEDYDGKYEVNEMETERSDECPIKAIYFE